ncbi:MAG: bifunctional (p)ppGpp synthetase/guanosine-3',5'-bis(diphosphate) 3'-pyrophosphohydrolase [Flavobacteriales bacterium]|nr:bifunctional (p)ppGpp synthetase/guanosine-3',5'-bis(diphosphate) 3'-pyrophosphohydrolase [Flavobacteriales bacterium]
MARLSEEEEKREILNRYRGLLRVSKDSRNEGDGKIIRRAFEMAVDAHKDMRRKSGEPYIYHPIAVARIAAEELGLGTTSIVCALLHDVVEDTDITLEEISKKFGKKVAHIIDGLTKMSGYFGQSNSPQAENFRRMLLTLSDDVRVILIKLCDRLHNMRTLEHMSQKGQLKIASETKYLYAPLAHRLGLYTIKTELEDLSLKYMEPEVFQDIKRKLSASKEQRNRFIRNFIKPLKSELENSGLEFEIKGRSKSISSILDKMQKQKIDFEQVYDLFAIRIIAKSEHDREKSDCWNVYSIVTSIYRPNPERLRDWISSPRSNGYESLHTTVMGPGGKWVEVQIRTERMDDIAEKGYAAHWRYKQGNHSDASGLDDWLSRVREILENPQDNAIDFLDDFKLNLFSEEIFVFTPKGDIVRLPYNATALDFAFEIHTDLGAKCIGAKVNGKLVPLSHKLMRGDQVEVISSAKQKPSKDWLDFVVSGKAKGKIRHVLKEEKRRKAADGKEILARKFRNWKLQLNAENMRILCHYFGIISEADFYVLVADDKMPQAEVSYKQLLSDHKESKDTHKKSERPAETTKKNTELVIGDDIDVPFDYSFAKCCNPIPGDEVMGFVTVGEGIKVHRTNCNNAIKLMSNYGYRIIPAHWADSSVKNKIFTAGLQIIGIDEVGLVGKITDVVSKQNKVNMQSVSFKATDGTFVGNLVLEVNGKQHLEKLIEQLKEVDHHIEVVRTEL